MIKALTLRSFLIFLLAWPTASLQLSNTLDLRWSVKVVGQDRRHNKGINCHALKYFLDTSHLKEFEYNYAVLKPYPDHIPDAVRSERPGEIHGFAIYDVIHTVDLSEFPADHENFSYPPPLVKMILVERKPGEFCEIYHEKDDGTLATITFLFR